ADYRLDVRDASGSVVVATYDAPLQTLGLQGKSLTVLASGFLNPSANSDGAAFGLWVALPSGGDLIPLPLVTPPAPTARVQIIHNAADVAAEFVDVYLNGDLALDNFKFRTATPFIDAPAGVPVQIDIAPATSSSVSESIFNTTVTLTANEKYVVVASGIVSASGYTPNQAFGLSVFTPARETASNSNNTDVLVYHGSTDAPTVDVVETSVPAGTVVDDLSYGDFAGYLELPTADYRLDIRDASGSVVVATYDAPLQTLGLQGKSLTVVASGFLNPSANSDGAAFGLWVALPSGGDLIPLPLVTLSNDDFSASQVVLYPNPAADIINIKIPFGYETISGKITDMSGRVVKTITDIQNTIDVNNLSDGIYIVDLKIDNYTLQKKIVIKK
ncbi:MAG: DUF4397 domain-containing protein, partial [Bacteroidetes bacterium]|nr:DUF4397 domain-containing protein [Bacteroidota bacterium]